MSVPDISPVPRWLRMLAIFTVVCTLPLVVLGAEVTTKRVGMVDKVGLRKPWHFIEYLLQTPAEERQLAYLIEHGHRQVGFLVGICCIVLAVGLMLQTRGLARWLGWVALVAVSVQGILGIFRVNWDLFAGPELATVHGCFAQLVFATLVGIAVMLSRTWWLAGQNVAEGRGLSLLLVILAFVQIVFGAITRHLTDPLAQRLHILLAFVVVAVSVSLAIRLRQAGADRATWAWVVVLLVLLTIQPILGVEAWMRRFGPDRPAGAVLPELVGSSPLMDLIRSGHHVIGTLIFAATAALAVMLRRPASQPAPVVAPERPLPSAVRSLEGAV